MEEIKGLEQLLNLPKGATVEQTVTRLTAPGENYGSLMLKIDIKIKEESSEEKYLHLVGKCLPPNKEMQEIFDVDTTFRKEILWYTEAIPTFHSFEKSGDTENAPYCFPKLYGSRLSLKPESNALDDDVLILLENLVVQGYKTGNRLEGFDLQTTKVILSTLARVHSVFTSIRLKEPATFQEKIVPSLHSKEKDLPPFGPGVVSFLDKEKPEYRYLFPRIQDTFNCSKLGTLELREPWLTVTHNDLWVNNMLLKANGKSHDVMFLDFQMCACGSPVLDLVFFLMTSVSLSVLRQRLDELLSFYYDEFIAGLKRMKLDTDAFTFDGFLNELKQEGKSNFIHSLFFVLIVLNNKEADATEESFDPQAFIRQLVTNINESQRDKICYLVDEFAKREWI
ncbi:hypothetical protein GWI33_013932 [Rhynchophorus ferrugineus]|uniref:CHK kinase-like domain-containing protein n=1 Tax=Rhynchophorus ferrugineus TaxID=354439 RepID=A0A834M658_RHYFE|nr:hypothetical protein GWI33_013932 [Rhynchophorus ferrugineus]